MTLPSGMLRISRSQENVLGSITSARSLLRAHGQAAVGVKGQELDRSPPWSRLWQLDGSDLGKPLGVELQQRTLLASDEEQPIDGAKGEGIDFDRPIGDRDSRVHENPLIDVPKAWHAVGSASGQLLAVRAEGEGVDRSDRGVGSRGGRVKARSGRKLGTSQRITVSSFPPDARIRLFGSKARQSTLER